MTSRQTLRGMQKNFCVKVDVFSAVVGIRFTHSHPLPNHTDRRCWYAAKEVAERTNNIKCISNYKRFSVF